MQLIRFLNLLWEAFIVVVLFGLFLIVAMVSQLLDLDWSGADQFFFTISLIGLIPMAFVAYTIVPSAFKGDLPARELVGAVIMTSPSIAWVLATWTVWSFWSEAAQ